MDNCKNENIKNYIEEVNSEIDECLEYFNKNLDGIGKIYGLTKNYISTSITEILENIRKGLTYYFENKEEYKNILNLQLLSRVNEFLIKTNDMFFKTFMQEEILNFEKRFLNIIINVYEFYGSFYKDEENIPYFLLNGSENIYETVKSDIINFEQIALNLKEIAESENLIEYMIKMCNIFIEKSERIIGVKPNIFKISNLFERVLNDYNQNQNKSNEEY